MFAENALFCNRESLYFATVKASILIGQVKLQVQFLHLCLMYVFSMYKTLYICLRGPIRLC